MARAVTPMVVFSAVDRIMSRPFEWGASDCCSAACDVFAALWGRDPMQMVRGYDGAAGAGRMIARHGGLLPLAEWLADASALLPGHAVGGLAVGVADGRQSLLVCIEPGTWAGKSLRGFAIVRSALAGWRHA